MFQKEGINIGAGKDLRWINSLDSVVEAVAGTWHQCETVAKRETVRKGAETKCRAVASEMPPHRTEPVVGSFTKYRGNTVLGMGCISCGGPSLIYHHTPQGGAHLSVILCSTTPDKLRGFSICPAEQLQQKDQQILLLLEEKEMIFRDMTECSTPLPEDCSPTHSPRMLFRSNTEEALKGGPLMKSAISEGSLHTAPAPPYVPYQC